MGMTVKRQFTEIERGNFEKNVIETANRDRIQLPAFLDDNLETPAELSVIVSGVLSQMMDMTVWLTDLEGILGTSRYIDILSFTKFNSQSFLLVNIDTKKLEKDMGWMLGACGVLGNQQEYLRTYNKLLVALNNIDRYKHPSGHYYQFPV